MIFITAVISYLALIYAVKIATYPSGFVIISGHIPERIKPCSVLLLISPDYWLANHFKNIIKWQEPSLRRKKVLANFININNRSNVLLSIFIFALLMISQSLAESRTDLYLVLSMLAIWRFFSRSFEISYAFGRDVFQESKNSSGPRRNQRISLAMWSYCEIFFYSAACYLAVFLDLTPLKAIYASMSVGTLTNVGVNLGEFGDHLGIIVFVQVFTTLSLVILSLAAYLSRSKEA